MLRGDIGVALTAVRAFKPRDIAKMGFNLGALMGPFSAVVDTVVTNPWLRNFLDLECFVLSGMTAKDTLLSEMAFMFMERNSGNSSIDYPMGGSEALVAALVRGIKKRGGHVLLNAHVEQVLMEGGRAAGVMLRGSGARGGVIRARKAVITNASVWDTCKMLKLDVEGVQEMKDAAGKVPACDSFVHLHVGVDA